MQRRAFLNGLAALPFAPGALTRVTAPPLPRDETDAWFWGYVQHAIELGDAKYCNDGFLNMVVARSHLDHTTDRDVKRIIRAAFHGRYSESDIPSDYRRKRG